MSKSGYGTAGSLVKKKYGEYNDGLPKSQKKIDKWIEMRAAQLKKKEQIRESNKNKPNGKG